MGDDQENGGFMFVGERVDGSQVFSFDTILLEGKENRVHVNGVDFSSKSLEEGQNKLHYEVTTAHSDDSNHDIGGSQLENMGNTGTSNTLPSNEIGGADVRTKIL